MQRLGTHGTPAAAAVRGLWRDCYSDDVRGGGRSPPAAAAARGPGAATRLLQRRREGRGPQPAYCSSGASMTALDLPLNTFMDIVTNFDCVMIIFGKFVCVGMAVGMVMQVILDLHVGEWVFLRCNVALACG